MLHDVRYADTREQAEEAVVDSASVLLPKRAKVVDCSVKSRDALRIFLDVPAEHCLHLCTTKPTESLFSTMRLRHRITKGAGNRSNALTMAFSFSDRAEERWRRLDAVHLLPEVLAGVRFVDGVRDRSKHDEQEKEAAWSSPSIHNSREFLSPSHWCGR